LKNGFLNQVVKLLNESCPISFEMYKTTTISRRVKKRMDALKISSEDKYLSVLKTNNELEILKQAIFINVSYFFRDKAVFTYLEKQILPQILKNEDKHVKRFWIAGCSTGEEVFSLVILLLEIIENYNLTNCNYKILASDIDELALNKARSGSYTSTDVARIPAKYKDKYFNLKNNKYKIKPILKENVIFAKHDLFKDPPFGAIDLVLCRNVLIYINGKTQEAILKKIKFSINNLGYLLLGSSESPTFIKKYFKIIDNKLKIFRKVNSDYDYLQHVNTPINIANYPLIKKKRVTTKMKNSEINSFKEYIYEKYQPAILIINKNLKIEFITKAALKIVDYSQYLGNDIFLNEILPSDLCVVIKTALIDIKSKNNIYKYPKYVLPNNIRVDIICEKFEGNIKTKKLFTVLFKPIKESKNIQVLNTNKINQLLKKELEVTEINLKETIQALEKSNQNFQSYNEELQSTNEEYLSVNEELQSINVEYQNSINDLSQANHYLDSLMESTQIATLFLDHKLRIKKFTKPIIKLLNITEKDIDRPVHHFTHNFVSDNWQKLVKNFLKKNIPVDEEFLDKDDNYYLLKIRDLKLTNSDKLGASVSFININKLKIAEQEIKENELLFRSIFEQSTNGIIIYDVKNLKAVQVNEAALKLFGYSKKQFLNTPTLNLYASYNKKTLNIKAKQNLIYRLLTKSSNSENTIEVILSNGQQQKVKNRIVQLGMPYDNFYIHIYNISNTSLLEKEGLFQPNNLFKQILNNIKEAVVLYETKTGDIIDINKAYGTLFGYQKKEFKKNWRIDLVADIQNNYVKKETFYQKIYRENFGKNSFSNNLILKRKDKTTFKAIVETRRLSKPHENYSINIIKPLISFNKKPLNLDELFDSDLSDASLFFVHLKLNGTFVNYSNSFLEFTGFTQKELQDLKLTQIVIPKNKLLTKTRRIEKSDIRKLITKSQEIKYCYFYTKRIYVNSKAVGYNILIADVTEEALKQKNINEKLNQLDLQFIESPVAILTIDQNLDILTANKKFFQLFGYRESRVYNLNIKHLIDPDYFEIFSEHISKLNDENSNYQYSFISKTSTPKERNSFDIILIDITKEVVKQQQINNLNNKYESMFSDSLIGQAIFDTKAGLQTVNLKACEIFGYSAVEFKKIKFSDICHRDDKKVIIKQMNAITLGTKKSFKAKSRYYHKNGNTIYTEIYASGIYENNQLKSIYHSILDVTKQTITNSELIKNEGKYKALFNNSTYGIAVFDKEQRKLLEVNKKLLQIVGCKSKEELLQYSYTNFLEPVHIDGNFTKDVLQDARKKFDKRKRFSIIFKLKKANQLKVKYTKASFYPLPSRNSGNIFSVVLEDIDQQIKTKASLNSKNLILSRLKKELKESQLNYKILFNSNTIPSLIINAKLELVEINTAFTKLINFNKSEIIGKSFSRYIHANDVKETTAFLNAAFKNTSPTQLFYTKLQKKDISFIAANLNVNRINIKNKLPQNLLITVTDLNELNRISKQLLINKSYLQAVLDNSFAYISRLDLNGNLFLDNKTSQNRNSLLSTQRDIVGKPLWKSTWLDGLPKEQEKIKQQIKLIVKNKNTIVDQILYKKTDKKFGYLKYILKYIKVNDKDAWLLLQSVDITDLIHSKTKLTNTVKELKSYIRLNLELEKFTYIASHDLKEPIRNIMSFTQLLSIKLEKNDDKEIRQYLSFILNATKNLHNLVNGILAYSKFEKQSTRFTTISVKLLLKECLKHLQTEINTNKSKIKIQKLPVTIIGDESQLLQLFKNIISNAIKFSSKNESAQITISGAETETEYEFIIKDNGIGISKKYHKKIFLLFKRLNTKNNFDGIGLGLKIAQKIVNNHGGKIWVDSKHSKGASFHFTLKKYTS